MKANGLNEVLKISIIGEVGLMQSIHFLIGKIIRFVFILVLDKLIFFFLAPNKFNILFIIIGLIVSFTHMSLIHLFLLVISYYERELIINPFFQYGVPRRTNILP